MHSDCVANDLDSDSHQEEEARQDSKGHDEAQLVVLRRKLLLALHAGVLDEEGSGVVVEAAVRMGRRVRIQGLGERNIVLFFSYSCV